MDRHGRKRWALLGRRHAGGGAVARGDELRIQRLLDGELADGEAAALRERLKDDPRLRLAAGSQKRLSAMFQADWEATEAGVEVPAAFPARVAGALAREAAEEGRDLRLARLLALAAAVVLALSLAVVAAVETAAPGGWIHARDEAVLRQERRALEDLDRLPLPEEARDREARQGVREAR